MHGCLRRNRDSGALGTIRGARARDLQVERDCIVPCKRDSKEWTRVVPEQVMGIAEF